MAPRPIQPTSHGQGAPAAVVCLLLYFKDEDSLYNARLQRRYAIRDDIPIMLIDEAETVNKAEHDRLMAKAEHDGIKPTWDRAG